MPRVVRAGIVAVMLPLSGAAVIILIFGGRNVPSSARDGLRLEAP